MNNDVAIRAVGVGKRYKIGGRQPYKALRDTLTGAAAAPFKLIRDALNPHSAMHPGKREDFWALKDVSFEIKRGEVVGLIGRNGAGKSTLLKILSRITEPATGRIELDGRVGSLLEVGTGFHPELTGRENIYLNGAILGMKRREITGKFDEIVEFAEIAKFLETPVKHYSSGMYMRLAFSVAAHLEPEILLVDEVLAVGDAEFQKKCLGKMEDVAGQGRTVVFVSHNLAAVKQLCRSAIVLSEGKLCFRGDVSDGVGFYANQAASVSEKRLYLAPDLPEGLAFIETCSVENREPNNGIDVAGDVQLEVNTVLREDCSVYLGVTVLNAYEQPIVFWRDFEIEPGLAERRTAGRYVHKITIPGWSLAPGAYTIDLSLNKISTLECLHHPRERLTFKVVDRSTVRAARDLKWIGLTSVRMQVSLFGPQDNDTGKEGHSLL